MIYCCVQLLSRVQHFATPWTKVRQASLSFTTSQRLLQLMSTELVMPSNHPILCFPLLLLPSASINVIYNVIKVDYKILNAVPWLYSSLLFIFYMQSWICQPQAPRLRLPALSPLVALSLFSVSVSLFLFGK